MKRTLAVVVLVAFLLVTFAPAGSPVRLSYVYSGSMEPAIPTDAGYVLVPAGDVHVGDVVTFWSPTEEQYVTHRVVGETADGFLTRGDANPTTDQATGHQPVTRDRIVGAVLTVGDRPLLLPGMGALIGALRSNAHLVGAVAACLFAVSLLADRRPGRPVTHVGDVAGPLLFLAILVAVLGVAAGGVSYRETFVVVEPWADDGAPHLVHVGEPEHVEYVVQHARVPLTRRVVSADGLTRLTQSRNATSVLVTATVPPQDATGSYPVRLDVGRYPAVLPAGVTRWLHGVHPFLAAATTVLVATAPLWVAYVLVVDRDRPIRPTCSRWRRILFGGLE